MDFQKDVLDRSFTVPVVVDFWAPWCGPCRMLGPVIEQLAEEQKGKWELVKINTEEEEELSQRYRIMSIPNVKMFYRGEIHHEFSGALPKGKIQEWLDKVLPGEGLMALDRLLKDTNEPTIQDLQKLLEQYPDSEEIAFVLSQILLWEHPENSSELVANIKMSSPFYAKSENIKTIASFLIRETQDPQVEEIKQLLRASNITEAIPKMIEVLQQNNKIDDGHLAKVALGIFSLLGNQHPLSKEHRRKLDMVLN